MSERLKLCAVDHEDLQVIAAVLQDALIPVSDMKFLAAERQFVLVVNRFRWENCSDDPDAPVVAVSDSPSDSDCEPCRAFERVHCGLRFDGVTQVRARGIDQRDRGRILELLHIGSEPGAVTMIFAGDTAIRVEGPDVVCRVEDIDEPWPTTWRPHHQLGKIA